MSQIHLMSADLANRIAAGEVIDRPASVVKELVENSIDAHSTHIRVSVLGAGKTEIRVQDDGVGMDRIDAELCFLRHASSKIKSVFDLKRITTLGFRGEALPSIASISHVEMTTWDGLTPAGTKVTIVPGKDPVVEDSINRQGTIFTIRDLFFNTPARFKYLKSDATENSQIIEVMEHLALGYPAISFELELDGKVVLKTSGRNDRAQAISEVYGVHYVKEMLPVSKENDLFGIEGYVGKPSVSFANRFHIITFINNRSVYIYKVNQALVNAFKDYLPPNRYPFAVLFIKVDSSLVDINVHPSKKEVRVSSEEKLGSLVTETVKEVLRGDRPEYVEVKIETPKAKPEIEPVKVVPAKEEQLTLDEIISIIDPLPNEPIVLKDSVSSKEEVKIETVDVTGNLETVSDPFANEKKTTLPELIPIGQVLKTYIVCDSNDGLYLIDQHAAAERINYEKALVAFAREEINTIAPLDPIVIDLPPSVQAKLDDEHIERLAKSGFVVERFALTAIRVSELPVIFQEDKDYSDIKNFILAVLKDEATSIADIKHLAIATIACKASIKANMWLSIENMRALINELNKCHNPANCPHGRPTIIKLSKYEIEKLFRRTGF